jgi:hypothetical protein
MSKEKRGSVKTKQNKRGEGKLNSGLTTPGNPKITSQFSSAGTDSTYRDFGRSFFSVSFSPFCVTPFIVLQMLLQCLLDYLPHLLQS